LSKWGAPHKENELKNNTFRRPKDWVIILDQLTEVSEVGAASST